MSQSAFLQECMHSSHPRVWLWEHTQREVGGRWGRTTASSTDGNERRAAQTATRDSADGNERGADAVP